MQAFRPVTWLLVMGSCFSLLVLSTAAEEEQQQRAFAVPELEYNLKLLLDLSESEIIQIDRQYAHIFSIVKLILCRLPASSNCCHSFFNAQESGRIRNAFAHK